VLRRSRGCIYLWPSQRDERPSSIDIIRTGMHRGDARNEPDALHLCWSRDFRASAKRVLGPWLPERIAATATLFVACARRAAMAAAGRTDGAIPNGTHEELFKDRLGPGRQPPMRSTCSCENGCPRGTRKNSSMPARRSESPFAKVNTMKDIRDDVQLNYRKIFR